MKDDFIKQFGIKRRSGRYRYGSSNNVPTQSTKHLTNDELRKKIERIKLDKEYSQLTKSQTQRPKRLDKILDIGKTANNIYTVMNGKGVKEVGSIIALSFAASKLTKGSPKKEAAKKFVELYKLKKVSENKDSDKLLAEILKKAGG